MHQAVLKDTIRFKNPILFYNNHAHFQQTRAIGGHIGVGTGGVTEGFKNRVVMPLTNSNFQTNHVLGHELVHAFQYNILRTGDSTNIQNSVNIPLWIIEGMAEYMSLGRFDPNTAMWMRDAVQANDIPTLNDLTTNPKYFPYRYGQAFWAYVTGKWGDQIIEPLFRRTAEVGFVEGIKQVLEMTPDSLSGLWADEMRSYYNQFRTDSTKTFEASVLLDEDNGGHMNLSPVLSPNGEYLIFLSEKNLFSLDLFLADANTGKTIRQIASTVRDGHIDAFNSLESAGTWSPNSDQFAFSVFKKGENRLIIKDVSRAKTVKEYSIPGVPAFSNPAWSPDGQHIVVSGLVQGKSDLYLFNIETEEVTQLTHDGYSDIQPNWSPDGTTIVFATDRNSFNEYGEGNWRYNIALLNVETSALEVLDVFEGANNLNPVFVNNESIMFLSNRDGLRNIYTYHILDDKAYMMTNYFAGVSGMTEHSPALSVANNGNDVAYSNYGSGRYKIMKSSVSEMLNEEVSTSQIDMAASILPPMHDPANDMVNANLENMHQLPDLSDEEIIEIPYKGQFALDYASGGGGIGIGTSNTFGSSTGLAGGINLLFSDILGNNQVFSSLSLNGEISDFGGVVTYLNQKHRIGWGVGVSHIPYRSGSIGGVRNTTLQDNAGNQIPVYEEQINILRTFEDRVGAFAQLPLSATRRVEVGSSVSFYSYKNTLYRNYYDLAGNFLTSDKENADAPFDNFNIYNLNTAFVGDNSYFGIASPLAGHRFRVGVEQYLGEFTFNTVLGDFRKYEFVKPVAFAVRALSYSRFGQDSKALNPLYVGNSLLVRGYNINSSERQSALAVNGVDINSLVGSKILVSNFEVRLPLSGPERLSLLKSGFLPAELAVFLDGGVAFDDFDEIGQTFELRDPNTGQPLLDSQGNPRTFNRDFLFSTGVSLRVNLMGFLILEPFYAKPLQNGVDGYFGLNFSPGW